MVKPLLAIIGGFVLSFGMFVGGLLFAIFFFILLARRLKAEVRPSKAI